MREKVCNGEGSKAKNGFGGEGNAGLIQMRFFVNSAIKTITDCFDDTKEHQQRNDGGCEIITLIDETENDDCNKAGDAGNDATNEIVTKREFVFGVGNLEGAVVINGDDIKERTKSKSIGKNAGNVDTVNVTNGN